MLTTGHFWKMNILKIQDGGYIREGFNGFYFSGSVLGNQEFYQIILIAHGASYMAFEILKFFQLNFIFIVIRFYAKHINLPFLITLSTYNVSFDYELSQIVTCLNYQVVA